MRLADCLVAILLSNCRVGKIAFWLAPWLLPGKLACLLRVCSCLLVLVLALVLALVLEIVCLHLDLFVMWPCSDLGLEAMNLHFNILGLLLCVHTKVALIGVSATGITRAESACT